MDAVTVKISGLEELEQTLNSLGPKLAKKVADRGLKEIGEEFRASFAENAPKDSGFLAEHFIARIRHHGENALDATIRIGPSDDVYVGRGKGALPASVVGLILEFGRRPKGQGRQRGGGLGSFRGRAGETGEGGKVAARPFMTATFEALKGDASEKIAEAIRESLAELVQGKASTAIAKSLSSLL